MMTHNTMLVTLSTIPSVAALVVDRKSSLAERVRGSHPVVMTYIGMGKENNGRVTAWLISLMCMRRNTCGADLSLVHDVMQ